jgi:DNA-binding HxlR family transcriptional regulator
MSSTNQSCSNHQNNHCQLKRIISLLGDMWTLMIVYTLLSGSKRFGELQQALGNVSPKTLSQRLKMLEEMGIVVRHAYAEIPPRVEYSLTEKGKGLSGILTAMQEFQEHFLTESESATLSETGESSKYGS